MLENLYIQTNVNNSNESSSILLNKGVRGLNPWAKVSIFHNYIITPLKLSTFFKSKNDNS